MNSAADVARKLLHEAHVAIVPGEGFGTRTTFAFPTRPRWQNCDRGLERMRKFFAGCEQVIVE